uniref:Uncharacterized protein n=1 Tax=Anguilla anguilla TaxID=7936 RepID=A0A0E9XWQ3_ANGAN
MVALQLLYQFAPSLVFPVLIVLLFSIIQSLFLFVSHYHFPVYDCELCSTVSVISFPVYLSSLLP